MVAISSIGMARPHIRKERLDSRFPSPNLPLEPFRARQSRFARLAEGTGFHSYPSAQMLPDLTQKRWALGMAKPKPTTAKPAAKNDRQRTYLSQTDVPLYSLEKALKIPQAIVDNYGKGPAEPLEVAKVLEVSPTNTYFKMQAGAAIAYGLTVGGWNAAQIEITPLGLKILKPQDENQPLEGKREALLKPRVIRKFLTKY